MFCRDEVYKKKIQLPLFQRNCKVFGTVKICIINLLLTQMHWKITLKSLERCLKAFLPAEVPALHVSRTNQRQCKARK